MSRIGNGIVTVKPQKKIRGYHVRTQCEKTALVVIDLQEGILPFAGGPHRADDVVTRAARLAEKCRQQGSPVIMVRVGWSADFAEALKQPVDAQAGGHALPDNWWTYPQALGKQDGDIEVTKRQWGAFYGTDLELQLRRRGVDTLILCGISTNIGVESTARNARGWASTRLSSKTPAAPPLPSSTVAA